MRRGNGSLRLAGSGIGDPDELEPLDVQVDGRSIAPPAPVHVRTEGRTRIAWTRRSRSGWRWEDGVDAPLGEEREAYRVTMADGSVREVDRPELTLGAGERASSVMQVGTHGASRARSF